MGLGGVFTAIHALFGHVNYGGVVMDHNQKKSSGGVLLLDIDGTLCAPFSEIRSGIKTNIYSFAKEELGWLCC